MKNKILVVDDEPALCELIVSILQDEGHDVISAPSSEDALEILGRSSFPLLICDITMPGLTGLQLVAKLRESELPCAVVMLTAHTDTEKIIEALQLGAIDYISKPFDPEVLIQKVPVWLEIGRRLQEFKKSYVDSNESKVQNNLKMIDLFRLKNHKNSQSKI